MTQILSKTQTILLRKPLSGLESVETLQIKLLPPATLFSMANRFLRPDFPPLRDYDLQLSLISKGIQSPSFRKIQLDGLPVAVVEQLAQWAFTYATAQLAETSVSTDNTLDFILTLILLLEDAFQYDLEAMIAEDLALLESHPKGSLHHYYFKLHENPQLLQQVLESEGYRSDLFACRVLQETPLLSYWLCRHLTVIFPWSALLTHFPDTHSETFPYLARFKAILAFLKSKIKAGPSKDFVSLVDTIYPKVSDWIHTEFSVFSQEANIPKPIREMVLVEGNTEEVLLPAIAKVLGTDLNAEGIFIQSVGGKNKMMSQYVSYLEQFKVPISIVLDKDAQPLLPDLNYYQRAQDHIFILEEGEFEDIYTLEVILKTVNEYYSPASKITLRDLRSLAAPSRVKTLQMLWQELGLGLFDKVEFAQRLTQTMTDEKWVSTPMKILVHKIIHAKSHAANHLPC